MYNSAFPKTSILCFNVHINASIDSLPNACYMENIFRIASLLLHLSSFDIYTWFSVYTITYYKDTGGNHLENVRIFTTHNHMRAVVLLTMHNEPSCLCTRTAHVYLRLYIFSYLFCKMRGLSLDYGQTKIDECFVTYSTKCASKTKDVTFLLMVE